MDRTKAGLIGGFVGVLVAVAASAGFASIFLALSRVAGDGSWDVLPQVALAVACASLAGGILAYLAARAVGP